MTQRSLARYVGDAPYCYANSAAMLLASIGEAIEPSLIECQTAVGVGARMWRQDGMIYFSLVPPDVGLTRAFDALGFAVHEEAFAADAAFPLTSLQVALHEGPVLVGPLDMRYLTYQRGHVSRSGIDHFVLVTEKLETGAFRLHDPKGYPNVCLSAGDLEAAWRARTIGYARGAFRSWSRPKRLQAVSQDALIERCIDHHKAAYEAESQVSGDEAAVGNAAFEGAAEILRNAPSPALTNMLLAFGLPLGARRSHDLAVLLKDSHANLSAIKHDQSMAFAGGYRSLADNDHEAAADNIIRIGALDDRFREALSIH